MTEQYTGDFNVDRIEARRHAQWLAGHCAIAGCAEFSCVVEAGGTEYEITVKAIEGSGRPASEVDPADRPL